MTYDTLDTSVSQGAPEELCKLVVGTSTFYLTSSDTPVTFSGNVYQPSPFIRGNLEQNNDGTASGNLELDIPTSELVAARLVQVPGSLLETGSLTLYARHRGDSEFWTVFIGQIVQVTPTPVAVTVTARRASGQFVRVIPRMAVGRTCQNMLYDARCSLAPSLWQYQAAVSTVEENGLVIGISGLTTHEGADRERFIGGVLLRGTRAIGFIESRIPSTNKIVLLDPAPDVVVAETLTLYPGCNRALATCRDRFDNIVNFNGWHLMSTSRDVFGDRVRGLRDTEGLTAGRPTQTIEGT